MTVTEQSPLWTMRARWAMQGPIGHAEVIDTARRSAELPFPRDQCDDEQRKRDARESATPRMTGGRAERGGEERSERGSGQEGQFGTRWCKACRALNARTVDMESARWRECRPRALVCEQCVVANTTDPILASLCIVAATTAI
eukprot:9496317-Pyramimonas_sp.AAC.1